MGAKFADAAQFRQSRWLVFGAPFDAENAEETAFVVTIVELCWATQTDRVTIPPPRETRLMGRWWEGGGAGAPR